MSDPRSPWRVRRIPLEGPEVAEWFRLRGWAVTDSAASHAFIDEAIVADVAIRRAWHTALTLSLPASRETEQDTLVVHVAGEGTVQIGDAEPAALTPNDVLFVPRGVAVTYRSAQPIARIEIDHGARDRAGDLFHVHGELVSAVMITSAINALFHAHDVRGGVGASAAAAVAASLRALIAAARAEALAISGPRMPRPRVEADYDRLHSHARTILEAEASQRDLTIDAVATRLGTGRRRLERAFRAHGESPADVLRARRLALARALLAAEGDRGLEEIAERSGFASARALKDALSKHGVRDPDVAGGVRSQRRRE